MNTILEQIFELCNGIEYTRDIPKEAEKLAKDNGFVVIVGGSDDLMYCYGAESYMTLECEHDEAWRGCDLGNEASYKKLRKEAKQLGLKIFWCGKIYSTGEKLENYNTDLQGAFSYTVNPNIIHKHFKVFENSLKEDVYCTGIIIKLPENFKSKLKNNN